MDRSRPHSFGARLLAALSALNVLLVITAIEVGAALPRGYQLVYTTADASRAASLYLLDVSRSASHNLTRGRGDSLLPAWSPDGERIAFVGRRDGAFRLYVMNAYGGDWTAFSARYEASPSVLPAWSPDGRAVAFRELRSGYLVVNWLDARGSYLVQDTALPEIALAWSPDGGWIIFLASRNGSNPQLFAANPDCRSRERACRDSVFPILPGVYLWSLPSWSPDGGRMVFSGILEGDSHQEIYIVDVNCPDLADGCLSAPQPVTHSTASDINPLWSPDGRRIAFLSSADGPISVYVMEVESGQARRLTTGGADRLLGWSPDGRYIAFKAGPYWNAHTYAADVESGATHLLIGRGINPGFGWRP
jgi:TolB protein